jgi:hypothetical protein
MSDLAARGDSADREESRARARSLQEGAERAGVAAKSIRVAAESILVR